MLTPSSTDSQRLQVSSSRGSQTQTGSCIDLESSQSCLGTQKSLVARRAGRSTCWWWQKVTAGGRSWAALVHADRNSLQRCLDREPFRLTDWMRSFAKTVRGIGRRAHPKQGARSVAARRFSRTPSASPRAQPDKPRRHREIHSPRRVKIRRKSSHRELERRRRGRRESQDSCEG